MNSVNYLRVVGDNTKVVQIMRNSIYRISFGTECSEKQLVGWEMHGILLQQFPLEIVVVKLTK